MKAVMLAAGLGSRLGKDEGFPPKVLLRFGGVSLLERHLRILRSLGISELVIGVGYNAGMIDAELRRLGANGFVRTVFNPDYMQGAITTLWALRSEFDGTGSVIMMDGDVLYDQRLMRRLATSKLENCLLFDSNIEPGEEPVKICLADGAIVDFGKRPVIEHDRFGEWVGFTRFSADQAARLAGFVRPYIECGDTAQIYEVAIRDQLVATPRAVFGIEDITGLPWIEIDFQADIEAAERDILPQLEGLP